ncbi:MAG: hypothetical protein QOJ23_4788 [Actinomycetota bacterium]|nr:hypothetical protein [Actinomycetota bacterium]
MRRPSRPCSSSTVPNGALLSSRLYDIPHPSRAKAPNDRCVLKVERTGSDNATDALNYETPAGQAWPPFSNTLASTSYFSPPFSIARSPAHDGGRGRGAAAHAAGRSAC